MTPKLNSLINIKYLTASVGWEFLYRIAVLCLVQFFATPWTVAHQAPLSMGILQAGILEWVAMPCSRRSSQPRDGTQVSCIAGRFLTNWATREAHGIASNSGCLTVLKVLTRAAAAWWHNWGGICFQALGWPWAALRHYSLLAEDNSSFLEQGPPESCLQQGNLPSWRRDGSLVIFVT